LGRMFNFAGWYDMRLGKNVALPPENGRLRPYDFFEKNLFFLEISRTESLVCMKAMVTSNLWSTWSVKVVNHLIWMIRIYKMPLGSLAAHIRV